MDPASAFRAALEAGDVAALRALWAVVSPHLPPPADDAEAEVSLHLARTAAESVSFDKRAYSHRWLTERSYPSQLPDPLRPRAERLYPRIASAVGISVNFSSPFLKPAAPIITKAMGDVVEDMFANGDTDPTLMKRRMFEAKDTEMKRLFGTLEVGGVG